MNAPLTESQQESLYLSRLGARVRAWRLETGTTRKALAAASEVSERYLAQLEAGEGNISVLLLRKVARAMGVPVEALVKEDDGAAPRLGRVALIGLRGAGKSTLGAKLAQLLRMPFVELDREVEKEAGAKLGEVFAMYGQDAFRRFERRALERVLAQHERAVIATGGSLVTDPASYERLLEACFCVWLKASPEDHMARVMAQGDMRPFSGRTQGPGRSAALDEIRKLLADRDRLYARAAVTVETSGKTPRQSLQEIRKALS
jgi:XRE family aerobic/anaerobic benzoate catabolism transcriptional regulator